MAKTAKNRTRGTFGKKTLESSTQSLTATTLGRYIPLLEAIL